MQQRKFCQIFDDKLFVEFRSNGFLEIIIGRGVQMKVFVTGGAGYIGSHCAVELLNAGFDICIYDNFINSDESALHGIQNITGKSFDFIQGDILDKCKLLEEMQRFSPDIVLHFAALKSVSESVIRPLDYYHTNVTGTINILEVMQTVGCSSIVYSSSATVYCSATMPPYNERSTINSSSPYGSTKEVSERLICDWVMSGTKKNRAVCLRYFNPVGSHKSGCIGEAISGTPGNLMPVILQVALKMRSHLNIFGNNYDTRDGTGARDYIHVVDLADGHLKAIQNLDRLASYEVLNLGTGQSTTVLELINCFTEVTGQKIPYKFMPRREGDVASSWANVDYAFTKIDARAEKTIEEMCYDTWHWGIKQAGKFNFVP